MKLIAVCPTVERADLLRQLVASYEQVWHVDVTAAGDAQAQSAVVSPPPLYVVAQGHDDGTVGWCLNKGLPVLSAPEPEVWPFAQAVNFGVNQALSEHPEAEWLLLLNNDLILRPTLSEALEQMAEGGCDIIGAKLIYPPQEGQTDRLQHCGKWFTLDFFPFHVLRQGDPACEDVARPRAYPAVTFACVAIKVELWRALGGLDESFRNGFEDDDFCLRARELGASIGVAPQVVGVHLESQTTGQDVANKNEQWQTFKVKWLDSGRVQWALGLHQGWRFV